MSFKVGDIVGANWNSKFLGKVIHITQTGLITVEWYNGKQPFSKIASYEKPDLYLSIPHINEQKLKAKLGL